MKKCQCCKKRKDEWLFSRDMSKKDTLQPCCKACRRKSAYAYFKRNVQKHTAKTFSTHLKRARWLLEYLHTHPCIDCGEKDPLVLQFDHVRGNRKFGVSAAQTIKSLVAEIKKCEVRCANCHMRVTQQRSKTARWKLVTGEIV